jgi:hypothetical protein
LTLPVPNPTLNRPTLVQLYFYFICSNIYILTSSIILQLIIFIITFFNCKCGVHASMQVPHAVFPRPGDLAGGQRIMIFNEGCLRAALKSLGEETSETRFEIAR